MLFEDASECCSSLAGRRRERKNGKVAARSDAKEDVGSLIYLGADGCKGFARRKPKSQRSKLCVNESDGTTGNTSESYGGSPEVRRGGIVKRARCPTVCHILDVSGPEKGR